MLNHILGELPPAIELETTQVLKKVASAHRHLAELKGISETIPNQNILIDTLTLQEAKDSSAIENIITTHDAMYKAEIFSERLNSPATKEVKRYAKALKMGFNFVKNEKLLTCRHIQSIQQILEGNNAGFRRIPGTNLKIPGTGEIVYTPPQNPKTILNLMSNL